MPDPCTCSPGDGTFRCPWESECLDAWLGRHSLGYLLNLSGDEIKAVLAARSGSDTKGHP